MGTGAKFKLSPHTEDSVQLILNSRIQNKPTYRGFITTHFEFEKAKFKLILQSEDSITHVEFEKAKFKFGTAESV